MRVLTEEGAGIETGWLHTTGNKVGGVEGRVQGLHFAVLFEMVPRTLVGAKVIRTPFSLVLQRVGSAAGSRIDFCLRGSERVDSEWCSRSRPLMHQSNALKPR